jgi:DNA polymerase-3 subunit epsilon
LKFAITDIETTGSYASGNSIIEIGICVVEDDKIIEEFHTLLNPGISLPPFIIALTGIQTHMLASAPSFSQVADDIADIFKDAVFVAHNVNFDFSFFKAEFEALGMTFNPPKLCTIKLARKAFPGMRSYGLGNICRDLQIINDAPHRALGDARATTSLFYKCLANVDFDVVQKLMGRTTTENFLPQHIDRAEYDKLPERTGVYYFLNQLGKPIYIGKAKNIKKRVRSHFAGPLNTAKLQGFIRDIHQIEFRETGDETLALLLEDSEIRKHWPPYNRAQKAKTNYYNIISYEDQRGYLRLAVHKGKYASNIIQSFTSSIQARNWLIETTERFNIDLRLIGLDTGLEKKEWPEIDEHNNILFDALETLKKEQASYVLHKQGKAKGEVAFIYIEKGLFQGFGFAPYEVQITNLEELLSYIEKFPVTEINQSIALSLLENPRLWKKTEVSTWETSESL